MDDNNIDWNTDPTPPESLDWITNPVTVWTTSRTTQRVSGMEPRQRRTVWRTTSQKPRTYDDDGRILDVELAHRIALLDDRIITNEREEKRLALERYHNSYRYLIPMAFRLTPMWVKLTLFFVLGLVGTILYHSVFY